MKLLALLLTLIFLGTAAFTLGRNRAIRPADSIRYNPEDCKVEDGAVKPGDKGLKFQLKITGSDCDGYTILASNPTSGKKWNCTADFKFRGFDKDDKFIEIPKKISGTVREDQTSEYSFAGEAGLGGKRLSILWFDVTCE